MQYIGRVKVIVNGTVLDSKPGATLDMGGMKRDPVVNEHTMGYSETPTPAKIECTLSLKRGVSVSDINNLVNASCTFETDTGQRYLIKDAFRSETLNISGGDAGGVKVVIMGEPAEEIVS